MSVEIMYDEKEYEESENSKSSRGWVFTDFKIPEVLEEDYYDVEKMGCQYMIYGYEIAPTTGRRHHQGYVYFENAKSFSKMKKLFPQCRLAKAKGTAQQNYVYCSKGGEFWEYGDMPSQGKRSDLDRVSEMVKEKKSLSEVARAYPSEYIKYHKGIRALMDALMEHRTEKPRVYWFWGEAGAGKTRKAIEEICQGDYYIKDETEWWDGYHQQNTIIIDDFDYEKTNYRSFLRLLDRYHYQGQYKGGYLKINSPNIVITSDLAPSSYWSGNVLEQVMRRVDVCEEIKK